MIFEQKLQKSIEYPSNVIVLFDNGNNYEAIGTDADVIGNYLDLPIKTHKIKNSFYGIEKHHFIKFSKSLYDLLIQKLNKRLEVVIILGSKK